MPLVITDASVLIGLERVGYLSLLPDLFGEVMAPTAVADEFSERPGWLRVVSVGESETLGEVRALQLDLGETEASALALTIPVPRSPRRRPPRHLPAVRIRRRPDQGRTRHRLA